MTVRQRRAAALTALLCVVPAACGQPPTPLDIGMREVRNDIVLGAQSREEPVTPAPPIPPTAVVIDVPILLPPAPSRFAPPPPPPSPPPAPSPRPGGPVAVPSPSPVLDACPEDDPRDAPAIEASRIGAVPPAEETLVYRNDGSFSVSGANANEGTFEGDTFRAVEDVEVDDNGDFRYAVAAELAGTVTTTHYEARIEPTDAQASPLLAGQGIRDDRGLYVTSVVTEGPDGSVSRFRPTPAMLVLPFPNNDGVTFSVRSVDLVSGVTMAYDATVVGKGRVNACSVPLEGITVELTNGTVMGPSTDVDFTARYVFATQFGGLSIEDEFTTAGTEGGQTSSSTNVARINRSPSARPEGVQP
jgi:hypothetical protein